MKLDEPWDSLGAVCYVIALLPARWRQLSAERAGGQGQAQAQARYSYAQPASSAQTGKLVNC